MISLLFFTFRGGGGGEGATSSKTVDKEGVCSPQFKMRTLRASSTLWPAPVIDLITVAKAFKRHLGNNDISIFFNAGITVLHESLPGVRHCFVDACVTWRDGREGGDPNISIIEMWRLMAI